MLKYMHTYKKRFVNITHDSEFDKQVSLYKGQLYNFTDFLHRIIISCIAIICIVNVAPIVGFRKQLYLIHSSRSIHL